MPRRSDFDRIAILSAVVLLATAASIVVGLLLQGTLGPS